MECIFRYFHYQKTKNVCKKWHWNKFLSLKHYSNWNLIYGGCLPNTPKLSWISVNASWALWYKIILRWFCTLLRNLVIYCWLLHFTKSVNRLRRTISSVWLFSFVTWTRNSKSRAATARDNLNLKHAKFLRGRMH